MPAGDQGDGYFVFKQAARTAEGSDGSGYRVLEYVTHTYGRNPEEYLQWGGRMTNSNRPAELIFFKISDAIRLKPSYRTIPEKTELVKVEKIDEPITDLRWME